MQTTTVREYVTLNYSRRAGAEPNPVPIIPYRLEKVIRPTPKRVVSRATYQRMIDELSAMYGEYAEAWVADQYVVIGVVAA